MSNRHDRPTSPSEAAGSSRARLRSRLLAATAASALIFTGAACGSDDDDDMDDGVDQTEVTSASGSAVPGQPQQPVNTDPLDSQVTPTQAP